MPCRFEIVHAEAESDALAGVRLVAMALLLAVFALGLILGLCVGIWL